MIDLALALDIVWEVQHFRLIQAMPQASHRGFVYLYVQTVLSVATALLSTYFGALAGYGFSRFFFYRSTHQNICKAISPIRDQRQCGRAARNRNGDEHPVVRGETGIHY